MADLYDQLTPADQGAFRAALFARLVPSACPSVDLAGIVGPASLTDAGNRGVAIDCFQTANKVGGAGPGVLDLATYRAIVSPGMPTWEKVVLAGAAVVAGLAIFGKGRRRRRKKR